MLANFLIGLREGLEAALVVSILVAYLVRTGRRDRLGALWLGVGAAVGVSIAAGALLTYTSQSLSERAQEAFAGVMSIIAVAFVTWMIFWMRRTARLLKGELQHRLDVAAGLGILVYRRSVRLDLAVFFRYTGAALVVVAAGVLAYGFHDLQEAGVLVAFGLDHVVFDANAILSPARWWGALFKGLFSISAAPTRLELGMWMAYLVPTMVLFLRPGATPPPPGSRSPQVAGAQS